MPQKYKTKTKRKNQPKAQRKPVSLMRSKSYWITLTIITLVLTFAYGDLMKISEEKEALIFVSILFLIGFAFYLGFKPYTNYNKRATFIFVGASVIGFCIWVSMVFSLDATGISSQIASSLGGSLFAITSLIICLIAGAFVGDLIGKNRERISFFINDKFRN
jgi:FtsH-binding integral membrane protein